MYTDIVEIQKFYASVQGRRVANALRDKISGRWPINKGEGVLALGFGEPLLDLADNAAFFNVLMPAEQGVCPVLRFGKNVSCLADFGCLPLPDCCVDRVFLLHALEGSRAPDVLLSEVWRILKSGGSVVSIVPNRIGFWAYSDKTPFGYGQPYSVIQARALLSGQGFDVCDDCTALALPFGLSGMGDSAERLLSRLMPSFGGALMVFARKNVKACVEAKKKTRKLVFPLVYTAPQPARVF